MKGSPERKAKLKVLVIDASDANPGKEGVLWSDEARYMDARRSYLFRMADLVIIRNSTLGLERVAKSGGVVSRSREIRQARDLIVDTMAACGFGFA
jgi:hypothetical protein